MVENNLDLDRGRRIELKAGGVQPPNYELARVVSFEAWLLQNRDIYEGMDPIQRLEAYLRRPKVGGVIVSNEEVVGQAMTYSGRKKCKLVQSERMVGLGEVRYGEN